MTRNAARASRFLPKATRHAGGALIGALMLAANMLAGVSPAAAACSGPALEMADNTDLGQWLYTCRRHCIAYDTSDRERVLRTFVLVGRTDAMTCRARCAQDRRCRAVAWFDTWVVVDGRREVQRHCTLYGAGDFATTDVPATTGVGDSHIICILVKSGRDYPDADLDLRIDPRDQYRPGVPGPFKK